MKRRIKVLCINHDSNPYGGVPVFLINVFRNIDHSEFQIDFLTPDKTAYDPYREEIKVAGGGIYEFHIDCNPAKGKLLFGRRLRTFLKDHSYDIVHINSGSVPFDCIAAIAAKSSGAKVIVHSHSGGDKRDWWKAPIAFFMKLIMQENTDILCACSRKAALYTFNSWKVKHGDVMIIRNGIDIHKYIYNGEIRDKIRRNLNIDDCLVIGHIGRFVEVKNHEFLIDVFTEIIKSEPRAKLLLIGQGYLEKEIKDKVHNLNLEDCVIFLSQRSDVENFYQAMDVFLFPSLFEGLPITLIEAQVSGLPCFISDTITEEVDLTDMIHRISLKASPKFWAHKVLLDSISADKRCSHEQELREAGFDIQAITLMITRLYEQLALK